MTHTIDVATGPGEIRGFFAPGAMATFHPEFTYIRLKRAGGRRERPRYSLTVGTGGSSSAPRIWVTGYGIGNTIRDRDENLRRYRGRHRPAFQ